jgi:DNA mismatch repair protein MutL
MRAPIRVLDEVTASRIAAGEVVERPASIVKELVENSLDAGATEIAVEIVAGGRRSIRVVDDGQGIPAEEVELAFARFATSKLRAAGDLAHIGTLGFRGEALAAIGSVSHVTLVSRTRDAAVGVQVRVDDGHLASRQPVGAPPGTAVTVENLFHAQPARLAFLRNEATEAGHILDLVASYALAYPQRRFTLVRDGRTAFRSPGTGDTEEVLIAVFGLDVARAMVPLLAGDPAAPSAGADDPVSWPVVDDQTPMPTGADVGAPVSPAPLAGAIGVRGHVGPPHIHRATRRQITLFVNGRRVQDPRLSYAVVQAYHTLLPQGRFPIAVVLVDVPPETVDVNVHPAKAEIRFRDPQPVFGAVSRAVRGAVVGGAPVAPLGEDPAMGRRGPGWRTAERRVPWTAERRAPWTVEPMAGRPDDDADPWSGGPQHAQAALPRTSGADLPILRVVGQIARSYIVAEGPDGLYLIDQHAAHERVMYEQFLARDGKGPAQALLAPEPVTLSPWQMGVIHDRLPAFQSVGFAIEPFGHDAVLVRAVPEALASADVASTLATLVDQLGEGEAGIDAPFEARLVRAVCKQATVKAGQVLGLEEMRALVRDLEATASPRTCPHGRPTMVVLSPARLAREFGRT